MRKKIVWLVGSSWMVAALLLASCAPAAVEEEAEKVAPKEKEVVVPKEEVAPKEVVVPEEGAEMVKWTGTKLDGTVVEKMIEKPRHGGVAIFYSSFEPGQWDIIQATRKGGAYWIGNPVNQTLWAQDWTLGPLGTKDWFVAAAYPDSVEKGLLAESWEIQEPDTVIFHIRKGVHWALDPTSEASRLVGGRELTAADVVKSTVRNWSLGYPARSFRKLSDMENPANSIYVSPDNPWTVVVKSVPGGLGLLVRMMPVNINKIMAPEVWEKYGVGEKKEITNWRHVVGTGAFMLKDYVGASSITFERNTNYWERDPFFPENQLPYLDGFKVLIITDMSTMMAALRTGRIAASVDIEGPSALTLEDARSFWKAHPEMQWTKHLGTGGGRIFMRNDTKPFDDVRVRQALALAINNQELKDLYWQGEAEIFTWPISPEAEYAAAFRPLAEMPQSVQELYGYYPDRARQLLAEAGYPDGFTTEIVLPPAFIDLMSVIKEYWAKIGVDVTLDVKNPTVHKSIGARKTHTQMYFHEGAPSRHYAIMDSSYRMKGGGNYSIVEEPQHKIIWDQALGGYIKRERLLAAITEPMGEGLPSWLDYASQQVWDIALPQPYKFVFWQPWLKGFGGVAHASDGGDMTAFKYAWIDQELKKAMGH